MGDMFCFQCQQTAHNTGCEGKAGVTGFNLWSLLVACGGAIVLLLLVNAFKRSTQ